MSLIGVFSQITDRSPIGTTVRFRSYNHIHIHLYAHMHGYFPMHRDIHHNGGEAGNLPQTETIHPTRHWEIDSIEVSER